MKKIISMLLFLSVIISASAVFTSCGEPKDDGAEISVYLGEVYDYDPTDYYVDSNAEQVMSLLFEPLFAVNEKGKLKCDAVAEDYEVDKEERTILIQLRETYWSDGVRVMAQDFIHAWRDILLDPNNANPAAALLYDVENAVEVKKGDLSIYEFGAFASETYEITINYREGADYNQLLKNLASVATAPVRQDIVVEENSGYWTKLINTAISNGPFLIANISHDTDSFTLARNVGYHQDPLTKNYTKIVRPGQLVSFITGETEGKKLSYSDIENKTVFYLSDAPLADRKDHKDDAEVVDDLSTYTYVFNTDKAPFSNENVRRALSIAINRNDIISEITFGNAATSFLPKSIYDSKDLISAGGDMATAKELINAAKLSAADKNITLTVNDDEESLKIAEIVKTAWVELGFNVSIEPIGRQLTVVGDNKIYDSGIQQLVNDAARGDRDFDVIAVDWQLYSEDAFVALAAFSTEFSGCGAKLPENNYKYGSFGGYRSDDYDALIASAYAETDEDARRDILHDAEKLLVESACIVPLVFNQTYVFMHNDISKVDFDAFGNFILTDMKQKNYRDYLD